MIDVLQWEATLGQFDIFIAVTTLSNFQIAPCQGYLDRLKRMYGYLK
jgi:hypothetical protein